MGLAGLLERVILLGSRLKRPPAFPVRSHGATAERDLQVPPATARAVTMTANQAITIGTTHPAAGRLTSMVTRSG